jgi:hypothetical protein
MSKIKLTSLQILLVRKHHQQAVLHLPISQDPFELKTSFVNPVSVLRVDDKDETL